MANNKGKSRDDATRRDGATANQTQGTNDRANSGGKRGGRRSSRSREKRGASSATSGGYRMSGLNDISWYTKNPGLVVPTAQIAYPNKPGMEVQLGSFISSGNASAPNTFVIPGVMSLNWVPSIGYSDTVTSPASIAAKEIYAKVRSAFSGSLAVDAPDFLVYMMCLDSIFSYIGALKRIYRILDSYSPMNFVMPETLLAALGVNASTVRRLRTRKADFMLVINELVLASRKFAMPNVMDIFNRHYWLNDNVYADADSMNSQFYAFVQNGFYCYELLDINGDPIVGSTDVGASGAIMIDAPWFGENYGPEQYYDFGKRMIDALANSSDAYTMSGYLMRAYEGAPQFMVEQITGTEIFTPLYVPEVLMQIENAEPLLNTHPVFASDGSASSSPMSGFNIWQDPSTNALYHQPKILNNAFPDGGFFSLYLPEHPLNVRTDAPTPGDTIIASRLKARITRTQSGTIVYPGSETLLYSELFSTATDSYKLGSVVVINFYGLSNAAQAIRALQVLSYFDWHPLLQVIVKPDTTGPNSTLASASVQLCGDIHNLSSISPVELANLNRVCLYSELNAFGEA